MHMVLPRQFLTFAMPEFARILDLFGLEYTPQFTRCFIREDGVGDFPDIFVEVCFGEAGIYTSQSAAAGSEQIL